jgi:hypothetical protein
VEATQADWRRPLVLSDVKLLPEGDRYQHAEACTANGNDIDGAAYPARQAECTIAVQQRREGTRRHAEERKSIVPKPRNSPIGIVPSQGSSDSFNNTLPAEPHSAVGGTSKVVDG